MMHDQLIDQQILHTIGLSLEPVLRFWALVDDCIPEVPSMLALQCLLLVYHVKNDPEKICQWHMCDSFTSPQACKARWRDESRLVLCKWCHHSESLPKYVRYDDKKNDSTTWCLLECRSNCHLSIKLFQRRAPSLQSVAQDPMTQAILPNHFTWLSSENRLARCLSVRKPPAEPAFSSCMSFPADLYEHLDSANSCSSTS